MKIWLILMILFLASPVSAEPITISFEENPLGESYFSAYVNETKEVPVYVENAVNLSILEIKVAFDGEIIDLENVRKEANINYNWTSNGIEISFNPDEPYTGSLLLATLVFRAKDPLGQSTAIFLEVSKAIDNLSDEISYQTFNGIFDVKIPDETEREGSDSLGGDSKSKLDSSLEGLMQADDREQYAEENNLNFTDGKVKVDIITDKGKEERIVSVDDLKNLANDSSIKKIEPHREFNWKGYLIPIILFIIILGLALIYRGLR